MDHSRLAAMAEARLAPEKQRSENVSSETRKIRHTMGI